MSYLPFARKWRPQDFDEIIGQGHITTTLKNAILMNRLHHAYLFTGPRGIGKTSTARIFSKALNCEKGLTVKPCNVCTPCQEINSGSSMDVIEIDGASNRGIDEIRNLRETVKFSPSSYRYKIYIIDEVHMLTTEAFNALLKTLEEPPLHVKFIFATTEPHKVPLTILSRCQRFDFRRIQIKEIVSKLHEIAKEEKLDIGEDAFLYIAKASDGSMRDAESILDQIASFGKGTIHLKDVIDSLGMIEEEIFFKTTDLIINKDTKAIIHLVDEIINSGKDVKQFLLGLLEHFRNLMVVKTGVVSDDIVNLGKDSIEHVKKEAELLAIGDIFYIINVISNGLKMLKQLLPERIVLELCVIKLTSRDSIFSIEELLSKLPELKQDSKSPINMASPATTINQKIDPKPEPVYVKKIEPNPINPAVVKHSEVVSHNSNTPVSAVDINRLKDAWPILVKAMAVKKMSISSYLAEGEPDSVKGNRIAIAFPKELNFHKEVLEEKNNKESIEATLSQILDVPITIGFVSVDKKITATVEANPKVTTDDLRRKEPVIDAALNIFGGRIFKTGKGT